MSDTSPEELPLRFFAALADETRLRMAGVLAESDATLDDLATRLGITLPVAAKHIARLTQLGIVRERFEGSTRLYSFDSAALRAMSRTVLARQKPDIPAGAGDGGDDARRVFAAFFQGERIVSVPADRKKRLIVLEWLAGRFEPGTRYPEREVNEIINRHHPDHAWLRRELVDNGFMRRDAGIYWRSEPDE